MSEVRKDWKIPKYGELRFEVGAQETVTFKLLSGTAEVWGMELCVNREYSVSGEKMAIFTYEGADVEVRGRCDVEYISQETCMHAYLNTHIALEGMRNAASDSRSHAPRVIVMGQSRNTVSRILLNYTVRSGRIPLYVDLDVGSGNLAVPGTIGAQLLDKPLQFGGETPITEGQPILYFYGNTIPLDSHGTPNKIYRRLVARLAFAVTSKLAIIEEEDKSGAIICMPADSETFISEVRDLFKANVIIIVGDERLHVTVTKLLGEGVKDVSVVKLPKSSGVVSKDSSWRKTHQQTIFQRYFYGRDKEYCPFSLVLNFDEVEILRLGEDLLAPKSALPLGASRRLDESQAQKVEATAATLLYSVLGVSLAATKDQVLDSNIAGLVYVTAVDESKKQLTVLSACSAKLPSHYLILGSLKWIEK